MTQHTVAVQQVRLIVQGARHRGLAVSVLLQRAGIPPALLVRCQTLGEALRLGLRHYHGLLADFVPRLLVRAGEARIQLMGRRPTDEPLNPRLDDAQKAFLLFTFGMACWLVARRVPVLGVDYIEPTPRGDSSPVYQAPIHHDQPHVGLFFDARWLDLPVVQNPQSLREGSRR